MAKKTTASSQEELLAMLEKENPENFTQEEEKPKSSMQYEDNGMTYRNEEGKLMLRELEPIVKEGSNISASNEFGWVVIDKNMIPSRGYFYPSDIEISIRSANNMELKQWSTIDKSDKLDVSEKLNMILERCFQARSRQKTDFSWKDLVEFDRIPLLTKIRELTFADGSNQLGIPFVCSDTCGWKGTIPLVSDMFMESFSISEKIWKYYNPEQKCFTIHSEKLNEDINIFAPTLGTLTFLTNYVMNLRAEGIDVDKLATKMMPFFVRDWRTLRESSFDRMRSNIVSWSRNKFFFIDGFIKEFNDGVNMFTVKTKCPKCGVVMERPLFFRGGFTVADFFSYAGELDDLI